MRGNLKVVPQPGPMDGNPYAATAIQRHALVTENKNQPVEHIMALASALQGEATLALAYEQRTANMIAVMAMGVTDMSDWPPQASQIWHENALEVNKRLGLTS